MTHPYQWLIWKEKSLNLNSPLLSIFSYFEGRKKPEMLFLEKNSWTWNDPSRESQELGEGNLRSNTGKETQTFLPWYTWINVCGAPFPLSHQEWTRMNLTRSVSGRRVHWCGQDTEQWIKNHSGMWLKWNVFLTHFGLKWKKKNYFLEVSEKSAVCGEAGIPSGGVISGFRNSKSSPKTEFTSDWDCTTWRLARATLAAPKMSQISWKMEK